MRTFKTLPALAAVLALGAIGAANASAATFTASATGSLTGKATTTWVFTTSAGTVKCSKTEISGKIVSTASPEEHVTMLLSGCTALGFVSADISPLTVLFTANGKAHFLNTATINVTGGGCHFTVGPQTNKGSITYTNNAGKVVVHEHISGVHYTASGSVCGSGTFGTGTIVGTNELERSGGGTFSWDA